jgi:hypothetical protein
MNPGSILRNLFKQCSSLHRNFRVSVKRRFGTLEKHVEAVPMRWLEKSIAHKKGNIAVASRRELSRTQRFPVLPNLCWSRFLPLLNSQRGVNVE